MTPRQVASAVRQQNRAQRIVSGGSYPRQAARWIRRHPKIAGGVMAALGGVAAAVIAVPLIAAAGVGLGIYGVARHPAARNAVRIAARGAGRHAAVAARWLRGQWLAWRRRHQPEEPIEGEIVDEPPRQRPEPEIVDAEVVPDQQPQPAQPQLTRAVPAPTTAPSAPETQPAEAQTPHAPPHRQPRLLTAGNTSTINEEKKTMSHPFETATEALANTSFTPESGMDAEAAVEGIPSVLAGASTSIRGVLASIAEHLPQGADSLEHLQGIADALDGLETQANEQISAWKQSANWVWTSQD